MKKIPSAACAREFRGKRSINTGLTGSVMPAETGLAHAAASMRADDEPAVLGLGEDAILMTSSTGMLSAAEICATRLAGTQPSRSQSCTVVRATLSSAPSCECPPALVMRVRTFIADSVGQTDPLVNANSQPTGKKVGGCDTSTDWLCQRHVMKKQTLGDRLRQLRTARGMKQVEVADLVGVARNTYTAYETGGDTPSRDTLIAIADLFEASLDWIEGRMHKVNMPELGQFVDDPDQRAILAFFGGLDPASREAVFKLLNFVPPDSRIA